MKTVLGIDVAKAKLDVALRHPDGKFRHKAVENTPAGFAALSVWLHKEGMTELHVCMEATGVYWEAVAEYLADAGYTVSVVNPAQIKAFGAAALVRTKTDKADAKLIAEFCQAQSPSPWQAPSPALRELRALVLRRNALDAMRTQEQNRLLVARESVRSGITAHLTYLEKAIAEVESAIRQKIDDDPDLKQQRDLLDSIPGWATRPSRFCCRTTVARSALTRPNRQWPLLALTHDNMSPAVVCAANRASPRSDMLSCARRSICRPWSLLRVPLGVALSATDWRRRVKRRWLSSEP